MERNRNKVKNFIGHINNLDKHIKFTHETEAQQEDKSHVINFLDISIKRTPSKFFSYKVFRKPIAVYHPIHYSSQHHMSQKLAQISSSVFRIRRLTTYTGDIWQELKWLTNAFIRQGYPKHKVLQVIFSSLSKPLEINKKQSLKKKGIFQPFTYFPNYTETQVKFWKDTFQDVDPELKLYTSYKSNSNLGKMFINLNQVTNTQKEIMKMSGIVYGIKCLECNSQDKYQYIGETSRTLKERSNSHIYDRQNSSAVRDHLTQSKHKHESLEYSVLKTESIATNRKLWEAYFINKFKPSWNRDGGTKFYLQ